MPAALEWGIWCHRWGIWCRRCRCHRLPGPRRRCACVPGCVPQSVEMAQVVLAGVGNLAPWSIVMLGGSLGLVVDWAPLEVGARVEVAIAPLEVAAAAPLEVAAAASLEVATVSARPNFKSPK